MRQLPVRNLWQPLLVAAAVAFVYAGVLAKLGRLWWTEDNYSHGLLIPFVVAYILWSERGRLGRAPKSASWMWGGATVVCALLLLWVGVAGAELFVQRSSLVLLLVGLVVYFWGFSFLRLVSVPLFLFALSIPIPTIVFNKIAFPLQLFASRCAVGVMRLFDIPVLREGNVIELMPLKALTSKKLEVVEACSGIRSLMTLVTLAVIFAYFTSPTDKRTGGGNNATGATDPGKDGWGRTLRSWNFWRAGLIVAAAVPIAIITNAARVSGTGLLAHFYGTEVADGFFHSFSGWVVYVAAFVLLFAFGWLLDRIAGRGGGGSRGRGASSSPVVAREASRAGAGGSEKTLGHAPSAAMSAGGATKARS